MYFSQSNTKNRKSEVGSYIHGYVQEGYGFNVLRMR